MTQADKAEVERLPPLPSTPSLKKTLALAQREARKLKHEFIGREHVLLAMLYLNESAVAKIFHSVGLTYEAAVAEVIAFYDPEKSLKDRISALEAQVKELKEGKP